MAQLRWILRLVLLATLRTAECSYDELGDKPQNREISNVFEMASPRIDNTYVPYRGSVPDLLLSAREYNMENFTRQECESRIGKNFWIYNMSSCYRGTLFAPVCGFEAPKETGYMVMRRFLTEGSPDDDAISTFGRNTLTRSERNVAFRVMTPTILDLREFTTDIDVLYPQVEIKSDICGKFFWISKLGEIVATDDSILVDPSCHTNNSCGVAFLTTSVKAAQAPHVVLDQYCGQTIKLYDTPVVNVFSHAGIGCKFFPDVDTTPNCELTITSPSSLTANVTLVNFRKTTCDGYELKFVTSTCAVDICQGNTPTFFESSEGKMQIKFTGSASKKWDRYGFIIRLERVTKKNTSSQCSSGNSVQGATDNLPQVSTTAPAESPTSNPVQNPTDGTDVDLPEAPLESSSATEFISDPTGSFESESPSVSHKRQTNHHHLHLMIALGIEL